MATYTRTHLDFSGTHIETVTEYAIYARNVATCRHPVIFTAVDKEGAIRQALEHFQCMRSALEVQLHNPSMD